VVWGLFHGLGMVAHRNWDERYRALCRRDRKYVRLRQSNLYAFAAWAITMAFFMTSLIPFRASSLTVAGSFVRDLVLSPGPGRVHLSLECLASAGFIILYHGLDLPKLRRVREHFFALPAPLRGIAYGLVVVWLALKVPASAGTFIYQQF